MIQRITEELYLDDGGRRCYPAADNPGKLIVEAGRKFSFKLCRKPTVMGDIAIDQWWMQMASVYGQRNRTARNREVIIEYFYRLCMKDRTIFEDDVQESYILARLVPYARSDGSRRIMADAVLTDPIRLGTRKQDWLEQLERELAPHRNEEMDIVKFRDTTGKILGPPEYDKAVRDMYRKFEKELLGEGRKALEDKGQEGLLVPMQRWQEWMNSIGRRQGHEQEKLVLDILSYECRAALHRCYSAVWCDLLPHLAKKYALSKESEAFHRLWHLDQCQESDRPAEAYFHLFHGHVFALHPGTGLFVQTKTGSELIADWLAAPQSTPAFQRLLNGLCLAMADYARRSALASTLRSKEAGFVTGYDMEAEEARQVGRTKHRRLPGVPKERDDM